MASSGSLVVVSFGCVLVSSALSSLTYAAGQWSRAKHSVKAFRSSGYNDWHMRHAFFADMGGFVFQARDGSPFPLNATQLHWLVINNFVDYPTITRKELWDKSKQDAFTKVVTAFQVGYMIIQCIARRAQGLAITALELNAVAIVVCSLMTSYAWLHKPADVQTPVHIHSSYTISDITLNRNWRLTPLDFVDDNGPGYSVNRKGLEGHKRRMMERHMTIVKRELTQLPLPWEFATICPLAILYGIARLYLMAEAFAELRDVKGTAYVNVEWTNFIPHV